MREAIGFEYKHVSLASNKFAHKHCLDANLRADIENFITWFEYVTNLVNCIGWPYSVILNWVRNILIF